MNQRRIEAFTDGVLAIVITIMVLEMKVPADATTLADLRPMLPLFASYVLSFVYVGVYWNNHHHLLQTSCRISAGIMWANMHVLFWLSLIPFTTAWLGRNPHAPEPTAVYGGVLTMAGAAYFMLQAAILKRHGRDSILAQALGRDVKGKVSLALNVVGVAVAFVQPLIAQLIYAFIALIWVVPDRRLERAIEELQSSSE